MYVFFCCFEGRFVVVFPGSYSEGLRQGVRYMILQPSGHDEFNCTAFMRPVGVLKQAGFQNELNDGLVCMRRRHKI